MSWIHIEDEIEGILFLMERPDLKGSFNLTAPQPVQNKSFSQEMGRLLRRPAWFPVPGFVLKLIFGEMGEETILTSQRVFPACLRKAGYKFVFPDLAGALSDILGRN
jgi:NAD dependent epimerase/dehydratase family enzyme